MTDWYECLFWGGMVVFLMASLFYVSVYAACGLCEFKKALGAMRHD